jgi:heme/copper-type cytochrome/quinol oxidase subunit 3
MGALALPPAAAPTRRNTALVGSAFAVAAGMTLLGGLLASYFGARQVVQHDGGTWFDLAATPLPNVALAVTYASLAMSAFTAQWVVSAVKQDDRRQAYVAVGITLGLAAAFVNGLTFCWVQVGAAAGDGGFGDHMYALTVTHLLVVLAAVVVLVVMAFRVLGGQFGARNAEFVQAAALFWHFAAVAGVVIWWSVWFLEGGPAS